MVTKNLTYFSINHNHSNCGLRSNEIIRDEISVLTFIKTTVMYGNYTDGYHRIGLFAGSNSQSEYISSTWKCGIKSD
jgi:hypothetical protein